MSYLFCDFSATSESKAYAKVIAEQSAIGPDVRNAGRSVRPQIAAVADMVDRLLPDASDLSGGRELEPVKNGPLEYVGYVLRLIPLGKPLVKVAKDHKMFRVQRQIGRQPGEVGDVVLPHGPLATAAANMCLCPKDANADDTHIPQRGPHNAGHKSSARQSRVTDDVLLSPPVSAPETYFVTALDDRIAIVRERRDDMPDAAEEVSIRHGEADVIRR